MVKRNIIVYIAGPYSSQDPQQKLDNVNKAAFMNQLIWELGYTGICPHLNTIDFELTSDVTYNGFIAGYLEVLKRCDIAIFLSGWENSLGCRMEHALCLKREIPVVLNLSDLNNIAEKLLKQGI